MLNTKSTKDMLPETFYKWLIVGGSKTGKTKAFTTFPGKKLAIGLTPRTRAALAGDPDIDLIEHMEEESKKKLVRGCAEYSIVPKAWDALWDTGVELWELAHSDKPFPYIAIMLDDLTTAVDISMNYILGLKKKDGSEVPKGLAGAAAEAQYMPQMTVLSRFLKTIFLPLPCHIYVTGHVSFVENKDTGVAMYYPKCYGKIRENIASWFDEVYESKREVRKDGLKFVWKTAGYGLMQFLGSTIYKEGLWTDPFEVDLKKPIGGFAELLNLNKKGEKIEHLT